MNTKRKSYRCLKALSLAKQAEIEHFWSQRLRDPLAFIPKEEKARGLSPTEARKANVLFGKFAASYMRMIIARITADLDIERRQRDNKKIVAVGYGMGYDSKWLRKATEAGFQTWWVDVSGVAWMWATTNLNNQFRDIQPASDLHQKPEVRIFEVQSLLAEPYNAGLDLDSVEVWYLSRLLNCLSTPSAKGILQEIGRTALRSGPNSSKRGAVVIVNALSDQNPVDTCVDACGRTSIRRSKKMILANLGYGADRPVESRFLRYYDYFGKIVTAMTVMAKQ